MVFKGSKHPAQAAQFAEWLNTNPQSITGLITKGGLYPADLAGQQQPAANSPVAFYGGQNIWKVFQANGKLVNTSFQWGPIMSTTFTQMADGFGKRDERLQHPHQVLSSTQSQTISHDEEAGLLGQAEHEEEPPSRPGAAGPRSCSSARSGCCSRCSSCCRSGTRSTRAS